MTDTVTAPSSSAADEGRSYPVSLSDARGRWFGVGAAGAAALSFVTQVMFERGLGVEGFAQWVLVNSLVVLFVTVACFGARNLVVSEYFEGHLVKRAGRIALARGYPRAY